MNALFEKEKNIIELQKKHLSKNVERINTLYKSMLKTSYHVDKDKQLQNIFNNLEHQGFFNSSVNDILNSREYRETMHDIDLENIISNIIDDPDYYWEV